MSLNISVEPKREVVLYARIKQVNKDILSEEAERMEISESELVDKILDQVFEKRARNKTKSRKSS